MDMCMIEQVLSFLYYISPLVSHWREKGASVPMLENDLFSDHPMWLLHPATFGSL